MDVSTLMYLLLIKGKMNPFSSVVQRGDYFKRHSDHDSGKPSSRGKRSSKLYFTIAEEEVNAPGYRKSQPTNG